MALSGTVWHSFEGALFQKANSSNELAQITKFAGALAPAAAEKRAALGGRKWHKVAGLRAAFVPLAVLVIEVEPAVRDSESSWERRDTNRNEHEACVDSLGSDSGPLGLPKRAPWTDLLAVAQPALVPLPGRHERTRCIRVSTLRHLIWRDRSDPGPGRESLPRPALAEDDERNHAECAAPARKGLEPGSRLDRQGNDNPRTAPGDVSTCAHTAHTCARRRRVQMCAVWCAVCSRRCARRK